VADPVGRQTVLGLVIPGALCLLAGLVCSLFAFLVGVALIAFGTLLLILPAAAWRILQSLPQQPLPEEQPYSKTTTTRGPTLEDPRTRRARLAAYSNPAFEPKELEDFEDDHHSVTTTATPRVAPKQRPNPLPSRTCSMCSRCRPAAPQPCFDDHHGALRRALEAYPGGVPGSVLAAGVEMDVVVIGDRPPRYSTVVRESPLI
ncbi:hypothetical protein HPB47_027974, partial [Ixodes persulcatus]